MIAQLAYSVYVGIQLVTNQAVANLSYDSLPRSVAARTLIVSWLSCSVYVSRPRPLTESASLCYSVTGSHSR